MFFDPRVDLPNPGIAATLAVFWLYAALLADMLITRVGVWYDGMVEINPLIKNKFWDLTSKTKVWETLIDGIIRTIFIGLTVAGADKYGVDKPWFFLMLSAAPLYAVVHNLLVIRKIKAAAAAKK